MRKAKTLDEIITSMERSVEVQQSMCTPHVNDYHRGLLDGLHVGLCSIHKLRVVEATKKDLELTRVQSVLEGYRIFLSTLYL